MSLLAADIGNSHTVLGLLDDGEVRRTWRVSTDERRTADEWAVLLRGLLADELPGPGGVEGLGGLDGVAVGSTVPVVLGEWRAMLARHLADVPAVVVGPGVRTGLSLLVDNPREVGADRILGALAAAATYGGPAVVVGLGGTATTYDAIDDRGRYVGGAIAPGLDLALEALSRRGAQLRQVELARPRSAIARNTVEAIQSGLVLGAAAQVDGLVTRMLVELGADPGEATAVATGPLAGLVFEECVVLTHHDPWLTLRGLGLVFARNT